jgi:tetratricopeptide (TPR) repeat protein
MKHLFGLKVIVLILATSNLVIAQDDPARQSSNLPTMIGPRKVSDGIKVSGFLKVEGIENLSEPPTFLVSIIVNGRLLERREVKNKGAFFFNGIPFGSDAVLLVESGNVEIKRISNFISAMAPISRNQSTIMNNEVRQDITILWLELQKVKSLPGVVNANNFYQRSEENQKLFDKATEISQNKKKDEAISLYKKIVEKDEKDFVAWTELGTLYFVSEKYNEAEKCYKKSLELKPSFVLTQLNLGKLYLAQKQPEKAIEVLDQALIKEPTSADLNHFLGEAYLQVKKGSKAVVYLNEAIKLAPYQKAELHLRLAALYNGANLKDRAAMEYKLFLQKVPDYADKKSLEKYIADNLPKP